MKYLMITTLLLFFTSTIVAGPIVWTAAGDGTSWEDPDNWDQLTIPMPGDAVTITDGIVVIHNGTIAAAEKIQCSGSITIDAGGVLAIEGATNPDLSMDWMGVGNTLTVNGTLIIQDCYVGMNFPNGAITVGAGGSLICHQIYAASIFMGLGHTASLTNHGVISIDDGNGHTIYGDLVNSGTITIHNSSGITGTLSNSGTIEMTYINNGITLIGGANVNSGTITIDSLESGGGISLLDEVTSFTNSGYVRCSDNIDFGFLVATDTEIHNEAGGEILIEDGDGSGIIAVSFSGVPSFHLINEGIFTIHDVTGPGIEMENCHIDNELGAMLSIDKVTTGLVSIGGTNQLVNNGAINISGTSAHGIQLPAPSNTQVNTTTGTITMDSIGLSAIVGNVDNSGALTISSGCTNTAIDGDLENDGTITMSGLTNGGVAGSLDNSGDVMLTGLGATGIFVYPGKTFSNSGTIEIDSTDGTGINVSGSGTSWTNTGMININNTSGSGVSLSGVSTANHTASAMLTMTDVRSGLNIDDSSMNIDGTVSISDVELSAVSVSTDTDFTLGMSGQLDIVDAQEGISAISGSIVENEGHIALSGLISGTAVNVIGGAQFANFADGILTIDRAGVTGIAVDGGSIFNFGDIDVTSDFTAVSNLGTFTNRSSGVVKILDFGNVGITNNNGTFINQGTLEISKNGSPVDIKNINGGLFDNSGTIIVRQ